MTSASETSAIDETGGAATPRRRSFVTPEGIDLHLQLAEMSQRVMAFVIDVLFIVLALVVMTLVALMFVFSVQWVDRGAFIAIIWLLVFFFLRNFYFMAYELTPRGATPGKRLLGLRVATRGGEPLGFDAIFARNAMRELELFLPFTFITVYARTVGGWAVIAGLVWCILLALFPLFNRDRLRIGDLVAGTWVIRAPKRQLEADTAGTAAGATDYAFTRAEIDVYGIKELTALEGVVRRADPATVTAVAERIRAKIGRARRGDEDDIAFLNAYYLALRKRLETRLLFGHRRRDKFDRP